MESLANACGISRSTASRFFSGRPTSLAVTLKILAALRLGFDDVAWPEAEDDEPGGPAGAGVTRRPHRNGGTDGSTTRPEEPNRR